MRIGFPYSIDFFGRAGFAPIGQVAVPVLNLSEGRLLIPPLGTLYVGLVGIVVLPPIALSSPGGKASLALAVPNDRRLVNHTLFTQSLIVRPLPRRFDARFTNVNADKITR